MKLIQCDNLAMLIKEDLIAKMSKLILTHPTIGAMLGANELRDVPTAEIEAVFHVLKDRGLSLGEKVVWRERAPKETSSLR